MPVYRSDSTSDRIRSYSSGYSCFSRARVALSTAWLNLLQVRQLPRLFPIRALQSGHGMSSMPLIVLRDRPLARGMCVKGTIPAGPACASELCAAEQELSRWG